MPTTFLSGADILGALRAANAEHLERCFGVAYWGPKATARLRLGRDLSGTRLICDLWSEGCDADSVLEMLRLGASIMSVESFHAKTYLYPDRVVLGSANASLGGLGDGDRAPRRIEAAVLCDEGGMLRETKAWFEAAWRMGTQVDASMVEAARPRLAAVERSRRPSLLRALAGSPAIFEVLDVWIATYVDGGISGEATLTWEDVKDEYGQNDRQAYDRDGVLPFYEVARENLPSSPPGRIYLDFTRARSGKLSFNGIWKVRSGRPKPVRRTNDWLVLLDRLPSLCGHSASDAEMLAFGEALAKLPLGDRKATSGDVLAAAREAVDGMSEQSVVRPATRRRSRKVGK